MSEQKCFCNRGWTDQISLTQLAKFPSARTPVGATLGLKQRSQSPGLIRQELICSIWMRYSLGQGPECNSSSAGVSEQLVPTPDLNSQFVRGQNEPDTSAFAAAF